VLRPFGARPHWGKEHDFEMDELRALYPAFDRFRALRDETDPDRTFGGAALTRLLGP
jgi:FAD/FMN-containing dehydrogenase